MHSNTSIICKSNLLIYSNKKWIAFKSLIFIEYNELKDILSKIKYLFAKPNTFFSFLFQNKQLVLIYGTFASDRQIAENIINSLSSELSNQITKFKSTREITGYSIHSLLFGGLKKITKDSFLYYEQFGSKYYCKPFKFNTLTIINSNLEELLEVFVKQRLIITFSSMRNLSLFHISLFFLESSKKEILESVKIVKQNLIEIPNIKGELIAIRKGELKTSPIKSMSGLNDLNVKFNSMFKLLSTLNKPKNKINLLVHPKITDFEIIKPNLPDPLIQKTMRKSNSTIQNPNKKDPINSIIQFFESNNWNFLENISTAKFDIIKLANQNIILLLVLSNGIINIDEFDFTSFFSKGFNLVFISSGGDFLYGYNQIID